MSDADSLHAAAWGWGALEVLFFLVFVLVVAAVFPYVNWKALFSRRAMRTTLRGVRQYIFGKRGQRRVHGWRMFYRMRVGVMMRTQRAIHGISHFPVVKLWVDQEAFPRIKKLIRRARHTVVIQMFIWKDDRLGREMAELLTDVADRGVNVTISKEAVGDIFEAHRDFLGTRKGQDRVWKAFWSHPNIKVLYETHNDHAKVYIIDDRIFLLTGMNIADEYHHAWHDYMVELHGRPFVEHYLTNGDMPGKYGEARVVMNAGNRKDIRPVLMDLLQSAKSSIVAEHCYLSDPAVLDLLIKRSHEGVRIVLILPNQKDFHHYANMHSISRMLTEGAAKRISIFLYPRVMHAKILLIDRQRAYVGSANLIPSSIDDMGEVNVVLEGRNLTAIKKLRDVLREDILVSTPISRPPRFQWLWRWLMWFRL